MSRPWERYAWVDSSELPVVGYCISVASHGDVDMLAEAFGIDPRSATMGNVLEAWDASLDDEDGAGVVQIGALDGCALAFEPNGYTGVQEAVAIAMSDGGRYTCLYRSVNADMDFIY